MRLIVSLRTKLWVSLDMEQRSMSLNMDLTKFLQTCLRYSIYSWDSVIKNSGNSKQYWGSCSANMDTRVTFLNMLLLLTSMKVTIMFLLLCTFTNSSRVTIQSLRLFPLLPLLFMANLQRSSMGLGLLILSKLGMRKQIWKALRMMPRLMATLWTRLDVVTVTVGFSMESGKYMMVLTRVNLKPPKDGKVGTTSLILVLAKKFEGLLKALNLLYQIMVFNAAKSCLINHNYSGFFKTYSPTSTSCRRTS